MFVFGAEVAEARDFFETGELRSVEVLVEAKHTLTGFDAAADEGVESGGKRGHTGLIIAG